MTISPEQLAAFVDGELGELDAARVRRAVEADPALTAQVAQMRQLQAVLSARYDPILAEPVPETLTAPIAAAGKVVDFAAAREDRAARLSRPAWRLGIGSAIAASLVLTLVAVGRDQAPEGYADQQLAGVLDSALSGSNPGGDTRVLLSFRDQQGQFCRAWSGAQQGGIACRDNRGWKLIDEGKGGAVQSGEFRQAGSDDAAILAAAQDLADGPALNRADEVAARSAGWQR